MNEVVAPAARPADPAGQGGAVLPRGILAAVLALAAVPRVWLAFTDHGIYWPDEIFQSLEPAHRLVFGSGLLAWEYVEGARTWILPGAIAGLWQLLAALGATDALTFVVATKLAFVAGFLAGVWAAMRLAAHHGGVAAAVLAGLLMASFPLLLVLTHRCTGENASIPLLLFAALGCAQGGSRRTAVAGVLAGIAVLLRYQNGVALLGLAALLLARRRRQDLGAFVLGSLAVAVTGGLLETWTWGAPFASFRANFTFNLVDQPDLFGTAPFIFYPAVLLGSSGPAGWVLVAGLLAGARRAAGLLLVGAAFVLVHGLIPHKEARFLLPVVPYLLVAAAIGLAWLLQRWAPARAAQLALLLGAGLALAFGWRASEARFQDFGQYADSPAGGESVWHMHEGAARLLHWAGRQPDLCGVWVQGLRPAWTGGYTYLHRADTFVQATDPFAPEMLAAANYVIRPRGALPRPYGYPAPALPEEYRSVAANRQWVAYRREGGCTPGGRDDRLR